MLKEQIEHYLLSKPDISYKDNMFTYKDHSFISLAEVSPQIITINARTQRQTVSHIVPLWLDTRLAMKMAGKYHLGLKKSDDFFVFSRTIVSEKDLEDVYGAVCEFNNVAYSDKFQAISLEVAKEVTTFQSKRDQIIVYGMPTVSIAAFGSFAAGVIFNSPLVIAGGFVPMGLYSYYLGKRARNLLKKIKITTDNGMERIYKEVKAF